MKDNKKRTIKTTCQSLSAMHGNARRRNKNSEEIEKKNKNGLCLPREIEWKRHKHSTHANGIAHKIDKLA